MRRLAFPYRIPPASAVCPEEWQLVVEGDPVPLPEALGAWDYRTDLELQRTVRVDVPAIRAGSGLPSDARLTLAAIWTATGSNLRGTVQRAHLEGDGVREVDLRGRLRGTDLGGVLTLETVLVLDRTGSTAPPFAAQRSGARLWGDRTALRLQGDAPQFPMAVVDFARTSFPDEAAWHLHIGAGLHAAAMGSMLLLINERNTTTAGAFQKADRPGPVDNVVMSAVYADCARIMLEHALVQEQFEDESDFPEDSLGATFTSLFHQLFPEVSIRELKLLRENSPGLFASRLQAATGIFRGA